MKISDLGPLAFLAALFIIQRVVSGHAFDSSDIPMGNTNTIPNKTIKILAKTKILVFTFTSPPSCYNRY